MSFSLELALGRLVRRRPQGRCDGVISLSRSSLDTYDKGLQFSIISTTTTTVNNCSQTCPSPPVVFIRHLSTLSISTIRPHQVAFLMLNAHFICSLAKCCLIVGSLHTFEIYRAAVLKVPSLSDTTNYNHPCLAVNIPKLECISRQIWYKIQMDSSCDKTCV